MELKQRIRGATGLLCLLTDKIDAEVLDAAGPSLKYISTVSVGYDHIDIGECKKRGIAVGNTAGVLTNATADLTLALLLATARRITEAAAAVKSGEWAAWKPSWMCGVDLAGATVGLYGFGRIGQAIGKRMRAFEIGRLLYTSQTEHKDDAARLDAEFVDQATIFAQSDFLIFCCAFNEKTALLVNRDTRALMKPNAILINTARGGVVDQDALYDALATHKIRAAGLDVTTPEPLPPSHPLLTLPNCVVIPHIGSATEETRERMMDMAVANLVNALEGRAMPGPVV